MKNLRRNKRCVGPEARRIASQVAARYGLTFEAMQGRARRREIAWVRQHVMHDLVQAGYSEPQIGRLLNRDASTISDGYYRHANRAAWCHVVELMAGFDGFQLDLFRRAA